MNIFGGLDRIHSVKFSLRLSYASFFILILPHGSPGPALLTARTR